MTDKNADDVMRARHAEASGKKSADKWLLEFLKQHGETKRSEILAAASQAGHGETAVRKAKERNPQILDFQFGFPAKAYWRLADDGLVQ